MGRKTGKSLGKRPVVGNVASDKSAVSGETGMICLWLFVHTTFVQVGRTDATPRTHTAPRVSLGLVSAEHDISPTGTPHIQTELKLSRLSRPTFPGMPSSTVLGQPSGY